MGAARERARQHRLRTLALVLGIPAAYLWYRILSGSPVMWRTPQLGQDAILYVLPVVIILAIGLALAIPFLAGRSPHVLFRPEQIDISFADVIGAESLKGEVVRTLNTFLDHRLFRDQLGGSPRRGLLFEGLPGTGKTHMAKAMARQAGVPFLYVSATSFQSMYYGATSRKIRSYFAGLRKAARSEGGAIGFIEEIDAIATARGGLDHSVAQTSPAAPVTNAFTSSEGVGGVVNELLVQMQSFDTPPLGVKLRNRVVGWVNAYLPATRQIPMKASPYHNVLLIAATNRADRLDPALLRPGRFDKRLAFELPAKPARRELIDHFLARKAHSADLDRDERRDALAGQTFGYSPVMLERLFDEALVEAVRDGREALSWADLQAARLETTVGRANPVPYTVGERRRVATHEAGHAVIAHLAQSRRLEVLSIVKRKAALGLLSHGDLDEVYTRTRKELHDLMEIALGGYVAEQLWFGGTSTGPESDLAAATQTACEIVGAAGMGRTLISMAAVEAGSLSGTNLVGRVLADSAMRTEVAELLEEARQRVTARLDANRHLVEALRDALLDRDELVGDEISQVLAAAGAPVADDVTVMAAERSGD